jgi:hypothetical protein
VSKEIPRDSFVPLNELMADFNTGVVQNPQQRTLAIYVNSMMNAYDMLAARGGTDTGKRADAHKLLLQVDSPETMDAAVKAFTHEALAARQAGDRTISQVSNRGGNGGQGQTKSEPTAQPTTRTDGWTLHVDAKGNKAYVSPDGKSFDPVK